MFLLLRAFHLIFLILFYYIKCKVIFTNLVVTSIVSYLLPSFCIYIINLNITVYFIRRFFKCTISR